MLVDLLQKIAATNYLSGVGACAYFRSEPFDEAGIVVDWQDFQHPIYSQLYGEFIPYLSSIDFLFNCGSAAAKTLFSHDKHAIPSEKRSHTKMNLE